MSKIKYIGLCAVTLFGMIVFTGCAGKDPAAGQEPADEASTQQEADGGGEERTVSTSENKAEQAATDKDAEDGAVAQYPKIASIPAGTWSQFVMYSEGFYCIYDGSYYGFMTEEGEEIIPYIYEEAFPFSEGLACVYLDGKYGFIGQDGETKLPFIYDQASPFAEGLAYFCIGEEYGFIDQEGNVVLRPDCDSVSSFQEGRAYFSIDGLYGYLDKEGRILVEPVYEDAGYFRDGLAKVMQDGLYGIIGLDGEEIIAPEYEDIDVTDGFIIVEKDGRRYCFDKEGKLCLAEGWEWIGVWDGVFVVKRKDRYGLIRRDGSVLLAPEYDRLTPIPEKELVIAGIDGQYGVLDYNGEEKVPFVYHSISYEDSAEGFSVEVEETLEKEEGSTVERTRRRYGFLDISEGDFSVRIPPIYSYMSYFTGEKAVVGIGEKYGIIRRDGTLEVPVEYDSARLCKNGSMVFKKEKISSLIDSDGRLIATGLYDNIYETGRGYLVDKDNKYGFLNENGELIVPLMYDYAYQYGIPGAPDVCEMTQYNGGSRRELLIRTEEGEGAWLPKAFLQNHITPRAGEYMRFLRDGSISEEEYYTTELRGIHQYCRCFSKLYRIGEELVLYFYAEPYEQIGFPMSNSGFFVFRDGKMEELVTGYECGGSMRGDYICFWYDREESRRRLGVAGSWGGFGGYASGGKIYELREEGAELSASYLWVEQIRRNYSEDELLDNAELFYDENDIPYTKDTILEAEYVTEYEVDDRQTTAEHYREVRERYRYMSALDQ